MIKLIRRQKFLLHGRRHRRDPSLSDWTVRQKKNRAFFCSVLIFFCSDCPKCDPSCVGFCIKYLHAGEVSTGVCLLLKTSSSLQLFPKRPADKNLPNSSSVEVEVTPPMNGTAGQEGETVRGASVFTKQQGRETDVTAPVRSGDVH